jgi:hypothetical protein
VLVAAQPELAVPRGQQRFCYEPRLDVHPLLLLLLLLLGRWLPQRADANGLSSTVVLLLLRRRCGPLVYVRPLLGPHAVCCCTGRACIALDAVTARHRAAGLARAPGSRARPATHAAPLPAGRARSSMHAGLRRGSAA